MTCTANGQRGLGQEHAPGTPTSNIHACMRKDSSSWLWLANAHLTATTASCAGAAEAAQTAPTPVDTAAAAPQGETRLRRAAQKQTAAAAACWFPATLRLHLAGWALTPSALPTQAGLLGTPGASPFGAQTGAAAFATNMHTNTLLRRTQARDRPRERTWRKSMLCTCCMCRVVLDTAQNSKLEVPEQTTACPHLQLVHLDPALLFCRCRLDFLRQPPEDTAARELCQRCRRQDNTRTQG